MKANEHLVTKHNIEKLHNRLKCKLCDLTFYNITGCKAHRTHPKICLKCGLQLNECAFHRHCRICQEIGMNLGAKTNPSHDLVWQLLLDVNTCVFLYCSKLNIAFLINQSLKTSCTSSHD